MTITVSDEDFVSLYHAAHAHIDTTKLAISDEYRERMRELFVRVRSHADAAAGRHHRKRVARERKDGLRPDGVLSSVGRAPL